ncbi:hypothetical protein HKI87_15g79500 [Chloropicon roscoffensis]|uniref:Uncharacterized protein n=2 Tax=Chloropicon roscoffensis TaxID=1461544 RepID=A0AAX4PJ85_9CHLO
MGFRLRRGLVAFVLGLLVAAPGLVMAGDCDLCGMNERGDCVHASDLGQNDPSKDLKCAICHHVGKCKHNLRGRAKSSPSPPSSSPPPPPPLAVTKQKREGLAATGRRRLTQYDFVTDVSGMRLNGPALVYHFAQGDAVPFFQDATGP